MVENNLICLETVENWCTIPDIVEITEITFVCFENIEN
jgi:hypothetical protein